MLLTPPTTPNRSSSSPRRRYPNSSRLWQDYRQLVDVSVQTSPSHPSRSQITPTRPSHVDYPQAAPQRSNLSPTSPHVLLSEEQKHVIELVKSEKSLFFTGAAGTGKSVLLRKIIKELRDLWGTEAVAVTATTGIAGVNIGGSTVHSFAGIGLGKEKAEVLAEVIIKSSRLKDRWNKTRVLVIDEISMMDGQLFDKLEYVARVVRGNNKPFGGIQLVLSGDFFQLPPVPEQSHNYRMTSTCAFDARTWSQCILQTVHLTNVFRQKDNTFVELLSSMRVGNLTRKHIDILRCLSRPVVYNDGIESSEIFPLRKEVESCNNARLNALPGPQFEYKSVDRIGFDYLGAPIPREMAEVLLDKLVAVPKITLKVGARVMLIQNIIQGVLVNGSAGKVIDFLTTHEAVARCIKVAELARKGEAYDPDQPSPPRDMAPLNNHTFDRQDKWPLVHFTDGTQLLCAPTEFTAVGFMGNTEASRLQVPLILAWAMSIHKSQGQTLERVKVDLGRVFEKGQAYVAVSRATTLEHLQIINFDPAKISAHPRVIQWHNDMERLTVQEKMEVSSSISFNLEMMDSEEAMHRYWRDVDGYREDWTDSGDVSACTERYTWRTD
ncbi:hypothetical protein E4T56_gene19599 [Termitomyces sp. T112]|nr:hypothetical protein E4T56_gene19599 [Termitomyces sp. T112]KAH0590272.1 hypothetical protein H2248_012565 [Termitomyces sp. 'cryptogamus']